MKKLMLLVAMLAMVLAVAVPAIAQVASQEQEQEVESGDVESTFEVSNEGDNSNLCPAALQFSNTGNLQNAQGFAQYQTETDDIEFAGSEFVFEPAVEVTCDQSIEQAAAAG